MSRLLIIIIFFITSILQGQTDSIVAHRYYGSGKSKSTKSIAIFKGTDTVLVLKYHKNKQLKDSAWVTIKNDNEFYFGTRRTYYRSGKLESVIHYRNYLEDYDKTVYFENGKVKVHLVKPGIERTYNKKGILVRQLDICYREMVYVPKINKKGLYLLKTNYPARIKNKKARLENGIEEISFNSGALIALKLKADTTTLEHCMIEGFSGDTIFLSKFSYGNTKSDALSYDSTFYLQTSGIKTIYHSKNYTRKKAMRAATATLGGMDLIIIPAAALPFAAMSLGTLTPVIGGCILVGIPLHFWGKKLYKKIIPKAYDMSAYRIKIRS